MKLQVVFFVVLVQIARLSSASRILAVIPSTYYSHHVFFRPLWEELTKRGHEVVLLTSSPFEDNIPNLKQIDVSVKVAAKANSTYTLNYVQQASVYYETMLKYSDMQLSIPTVQSLIQNQTEHFDLLMVEYFGPLFYPLKARFNCPLIMLSSMDIGDALHEFVGNPSHQLMYSFLKAIKTDMNFGDRLYAFARKIEDLLFLCNYLSDMDALVKKHYGDNYPPIFQIAKELDMCFINTNVVLNRPRPITPATINIGGGMHMTNKGDPNKLPEDLKQFLDKSQNGVIYFTLGSRVKTHAFPIEIKNKLLATFASTKYDVLWRFPESASLNISNNVKRVDWVPQLDVLSHKNVKLFMTQGGLHSLDEALLNQKPMIVFPFLADQHTNAIRMEELGIGLHLNLFASTIEELKAAIEDVIENPKYKHQVVKYGNIMEDVPMKPLETAVWWTEYVLRHKGGKHLRGKTLPLWSYYYLDVIAFIITMFVVLTIGIVKITKLMYHIYKSKATRSKEHRKKL